MQAYEGTDDARNVGNFKDTQQVGKRNVNKYIYRSLLFQ